MKAIHMLGNGVPRAMGLYLARHVRRCSPAGEPPELDPSAANLDRAGAAR